MLKSKLRKKILKIREKYNKNNIQIDFNQIIKILKKETEFSEKIDELNQETDTLLEEIDKWQM